MESVYDSDNCEGYPKIRYKMDCQFESIKKQIKWFDSDSYINNKRNRLAKVNDVEEFLNETFYLNLHTVMTQMDVAKDISEKLIKGHQNYIAKKKNKQRVFVMVVSFLLDKMGFDKVTPKSLRMFIYNNKINLNKAIKPKLTLDQWMMKWEYNTETLFPTEVSNSCLSNGFSFSETFLSTSKIQTKNEDTNKDLFKKQFVDLFGLNGDWNTLPLELRQKYGGLVSRWLQNPKYFLNESFVDEFYGNGDWIKHTNKNKEEVKDTLFKINGNKTINGCTDKTTLYNLNKLIYHINKETQSIHKMEWGLDVVKDFINKINKSNAIDREIKNQIQKGKLSYSKLNSLGVNEDAIIRIKSD